MEIILYRMYNNRQVRDLKKVKYLALITNRRILNTISKRSQGVSAREHAERRPALSSDLKDWL